jgi:hypothetical protein
MLQGAERIELARQVHQLPVAVDDMMQTCVLQASKVLGLPLAGLQSPAFASSLQSAGSVARLTASCCLCFQRSSRF